MTKRLTPAPADEGSDVVLGGGVAPSPVSIDLRSFSLAKLGDWLVVKPSNPAGRARRGWTRGLGWVPASLLAGGENRGEVPSPRTVARFARGRRLSGGATQILRAVRQAPAHVAGGAGAGQPRLGA